MLEERFETEGALDGVLDFGDFAMREFFLARANRGIVAETVEKELDLAEGKAHFAGETDEQDAVKGVTCVTALATRALGRGEEADFLVIADGGSI